MAMGRDDLVTALASVGLCEGFERDELATLADAGRVESAYMDSLLMKEGEPAHSLLIVLDGEVEVLTAGEHGADRVLATVGAGAFLGEVGLLESVPRTASARATQPVSYFLLDRNGFDAAWR